MTEEEQKFEARKHALIAEVMSASFEEELKNYIKNGNWKSFEELDAWVDKGLRSHDMVQEQIRDYYAAKIDLYKLQFVWHKTSRRHKLYPAKWTRLV